MCKHLGISHITGNNLKYNASHAKIVRQYPRNLKHDRHFDNFKILGFANNFELLIKESLIVTKFIPTLNIQIHNFR